MTLYNIRSFLFRCFKSCNCIQWVPLYLGPTRKWHLATRTLTQQRLPFRIKGSISYVLPVYEDLEPDAVPPEPDPAFLVFLAVHAISHDVRNLVEVAYCRHFCMKEDEDEE